MAEAKHTPGPWKPVAWPNEVWSSPYREDCMTSTCQMISDGSGNAVAIAVTCYPQWSNKAKDAEMDANARLVAAAPDLLEALQDMVSDHDCLSEATINFARAAIAKATE